MQPTQETVNSILNGAREEAPIGREGAMALEHWTQIVQILEPGATEEQVRTALAGHIWSGLMKFEADVEITSVGGHKLKIDGYYRSA